MNLLSRLFSPLYLACSPYIGVDDVETAANWYAEKFDLRRVEANVDGSEGCICLATSEEDLCRLVLGPKCSQAIETPAFYATKINKAHRTLLDRGVAVSPVQSDQQDTQFFTLTDMEGNELEISEEP